MPQDLDPTGSSLVPISHSGAGVTEIYQVSSQFQVLSLAAAIQSGAISSPAAHRILLLCNNASIPENAQSLVDCEVTKFAAQYFSRVVDFNAFMYPLKPIDFHPRTQDSSWLKPLLRVACGAPEGHLVTLYLESIQAQLSRSIAQVFWDSPIVVHADGLMVFGPTRERIPADIASRIVALSYPDFLPLVRPILLSEHTVTPIPTPPESFTALVSSFIEWRALQQGASVFEVSVAATGASSARGDYSLVLGQYLSALGIFNPEQDFELSVELVQRAATFTPNNVVYRPHPSASRSSNRRLVEFFASREVTVHIDESTTPVEVTFCSDPPVHVVSCFSTGLVTASRVYGIPVSAVGTESVLERLTPYQNSNRIPATICDALYGVSDPQARQKFNELPLPLLVEGVSYCMQSTLYESLRPAAQSLIDYSVEGAPPWRRYVKKRRAEALGLIEAKSRASSVPSARKRLTIQRVSAKLLRLLNIRPTLRHEELKPHKSGVSGTQGGRS